MNKEKELMQLFGDFGYECGAFQNLHPNERANLLEAATKRFSEVMEGYVLVPKKDLEFMGQAFSIPKGCGDNSCLISPTTGAGTNGGCRCDSNRALVNIVFSRWQAARTTLKAMLSSAEVKDS
jgi:hypothetical protein